MERVKAITYEGDPDLHPVRSNESKLLVRMFYHWASKINEKVNDKHHLKKQIDWKSVSFQYLPEISRLYYREDLVGQFSRQIILRPRTIHRYDKSKPGSPRIREHLPPRISLRRFANHQFLAYVVIFILLAKFFNYSLVSLSFYVFLIWFCVTAFNALRDKSDLHEHYMPGEHDMSFNDSF